VILHGLRCLSSPSFRLGSMLGCSTTDVLFLATWIGLDPQPTGFVLDPPSQASGIHAPNNSLFCLFERVRIYCPVSGRCETVDTPCREMPCAQLMKTDGRGTRTAGQKCWTQSQSGVTLNFGARLRTNQKVETAKSVAELEQIPADPKKRLRVRQAEFRERRDRLTSEIAGGDAKIDSLRQELGVPAKDAVLGRISLVTLDKASTFFACVSDSKKENHGNNRADLTPQKSPVARRVPHKGGNDEKPAEYGR
jgi:hypothetical protein